MKKKSLISASLACAIMLVSVPAYASGATPSKSGAKPGTVIGGGGSVYPGTTLNVTPGDILITSDTGSWGSGFTGHAAIVDDADNVQQALGSAYTLNQGTESVAQFFTDRNNQVQVWRYNDYSTAEKAANEARYLVSSIGNDSYTIWSALNDLSTEYCSKFVWDAYYYGDGTSLDNWDPSHNAPVSPYTIGPGDPNLTLEYQSSNF